MILRLDSELTTSNSYFIEEQGHVLLIDAVDPDKIDRLLQAQRWKADLLILTHEHMDHIIGMEFLREKYNIPVICTRACSERIQDSRLNLSAEYAMLVYRYRNRIRQNRTGEILFRRADQVFEEELSMFWQGHTIYLRRCPGHSPGSAMICLDDEAVFTGDYLIRDVPVNLELSGGDRNAFVHNTRPWMNDRLPSGIMLYPGHGEPYALTEERVC